MADWSDLLPDLLIQIAKVLPFDEDVRSFAGVCKWWRSSVAAAQDSFRKPSGWFPCLILPETEEEEGGMRRFFSLSTRKFIKLMLPEASKKQCATSRGWLMAVGVDEIEAKLLNPFSLVQIDLPKLNTFPHWESQRTGNGYIIQKMVLSADPSLTSDFLVIVIWGGMGYLSFCRPGDASWTLVNHCNCSLFDITYHNGLLYGVANLTGGRRRILEFDVHGPTPTPWREVSSFVTSEFGIPIEDYYYIVESAGKLLIISRPTRDGTEEKEVPKKCATQSFQVLELGLDDGKWSKLVNLGNKALFLGLNSSISIEAYGCIKANCIYFTDDFWEIYIADHVGGGWDMGIYNLSNGTTESLFSLLNLKSGSIFTPPTWVEVVPSLVVHGVQAQI